MLKLFKSLQWDFIWLYLSQSKSLLSPQASSLQDLILLLCLKKCFKDKDMQFLTSTDTGQGTNPLSLTLSPRMVQHKVSLPNLLNQTCSGTFAVSETIFQPCLLLKSYWGILETHSGVQCMLNRGPNLSLTWEEVMLPTLKSKGKHEKQSVCYQPLPFVFIFKYKTFLMNNIVLELTMVNTETQRQVHHSLKQEISPRELDKADPRTQGTSGVSDNESERQ